MILHININASSICILYIQTYALNKSTNIYKSQIFFFLHSLNSYVISHRRLVFLYERTPIHADLSKAGQTGVQKVTAVKTESQRLKTWRLNLWVVG